LPQGSALEPEDQLHWYEAEVEAANAHAAYDASAINALGCPPLSSLRPTQPLSPAVAVHPTATTLANLTKAKQHGLAQISTIANTTATADTQPQQTLTLEKDATSGAVRATLITLPTDGSAPAAQVVENGLPPFVKMQHPPNIADTVRLWTLNKTQAMAFALLATRMHEHNDSCQLGSSPPDKQLLMLLLGEPGTGKSQVIKALEWYAFQYSWCDKIGVAAYTWRAALHISNSSFPAQSTSTFYGIDSVKGHKLQESTNVQHRTRTNLEGRWLLVTDEVSFVSAPHFQAMDLSCRTALKKAGALFGGLDKLATGDLAQLPPVASNPLYLFPQQPSAANGKEAKKFRQSMAGKAAFESFDTVFILTEQNRISEGDADGQTLLKYFRVFSNPERDATYEEVQEAMEAINAKAVSPAELQQLLPQQPKAVVLRNSVRDITNRSLAIMHANAVNKRIVMWRASDTTTNGCALNSEAQAIVNTLHAGKTKHYNGTSIFYEGCPYVFLDNKCPEAGWIHNNGCTGQALLLDPREPQDDPSMPVRFLKYPPLAMFVKPDLLDVGDACHNIMPECPVGCIPVTLQTTTFSVALPAPITVTTAAGKQVTLTSLTVQRRNLPLGDGLAFTDHYCQVRCSS
jgi:hypothetical protein